MKLGVCHQVKERSKEIYKTKKTDKLLHPLTVKLLNYLSIIFSNLLIKFPYFK